MSRVSTEDTNPSAIIQRAITSDKITLALAVALPPLGEDPIMLRERASQYVKAAPSSAGRRRFIFDSSKVQRIYNIAGGGLFGGLRRVSVCFFDTSPANFSNHRRSAAASYVEDSVSKHCFLQYIYQTLNQRMSTEQDASTIEPFAMVSYINYDQDGTLYPTYYATQQDINMWRCLYLGHTPPPLHQYRGVDHPDQGAELRDLAIKHATDQILEQLVQQLFPLKGYFNSNRTAQSLIRAEFRDMLGLPQTPRARGRSTRTSLFACLGADQAAALSSADEKAKIQAAIKSAVEALQLEDHAASCDGGGAAAAGAGI